MDKPPRSPNTPWWAARAHRPPEPASDTDYADMGTAFGLDASMKLPEPDAPRPVPGDFGPSTDRLNRRSVL